MLDDRLIPSSDIYKIHEGFYKNRLQLEDLIFGVDTESLKLRTQIARTNENIDSVLEKYSKTKLTENEAFELAALKESIVEYRDLEERIQQLYYTGDIETAREMFKTDELIQFQILTEELHKLAAIQVYVGGELYEDAKDKLFTINLISYLSIAIAIFLTFNLLKVLGINLSKR